MVRGHMEKLKMRSKLIGLIGAAGCGKSEFIKNIPGKVHVLPMAAYLKKIAYDMGWDGKKDEKGRRLLQLLGTECGRECIGEDVWVNIWTKDYFIHADNYDTIVVDDVRFENEVKTIRMLNGVMVRIDGRSDDLGTNAKHDSENHAHLDHQFLVHNGSTMADYVAAIKEVLCRI